MSAKDKAMELVTKYAELEFGCNDKIVFSKMHKKQALIAVDLAIEYNDFHIEFLQEVKQEIQLL